MTRTRRLVLFLPSLALLAAALVLPALPSCQKAHAGATSGNSPPIPRGGGGGGVTSVAAGTNVTIGGTATVPIVNATTQFSSDTSITQPNSAAADVTAWRGQVLFSTNTAGAEVGHWLLSQPRSGISHLSTYDLTPDGLTTNTDGTSTKYQFKNGGVAVAYVEGDIGSSGRLQGVSAVKLRVGATDRFSLSGVDGLWITAPFQPAQGANVAAASNLNVVAGGVLTGGNTVVVTGATQIDRFAAAGILYDGYEFNLIFTGGPLIKHNTAVSGTNFPIMLKGSIDKTPAVNDRARFGLATVGGVRALWQLTDWLSS